jgi:hypothetical protein
VPRPTSDAVRATSGREANVYETGIAPAPPGSRRDVWVPRHAISLFCSGLLVGRLDEAEELVALAKSVTSHECIFFGCFFVVISLGSCAPRSGLT